MNAVGVLRAVFALTLACAAIALGLTAWYTARCATMQLWARGGVSLRSPKVRRNADDARFEAAFAALSGGLRASFNDSFTRLYLAASTLAEIAADVAADTGQTWPNVTLPNYNACAWGGRRLSLLGRFA